MESKSLVLSLVLAFLLVGAGFSLVAMDSTSEEQDDSIVFEQDTTVLVNNPPSVLTPAVVSMDWTGENATLSGFVTDEVPQNTSLSVRMLDLNFAELTAYNMTPALDGAWTVETSLHDPGEWIVELIAVDNEQQVSERILIELIIVAPIEPQVTLTFRWDEPVENETNGNTQWTRFTSVPRLLYGGISSSWPKSSSPCCRSD